MHLDGLFAARNDRMQPIGVGPVPPIPYPSMTLRSRRELPTRDTVNARNYEHWQTDGRYGIYDRRDLNAAPTFMDRLPSAGRLDRRDNRPAAAFDANGPQLNGNVYFDKFDVQSDPRNVVRELQGAVYESREDRGIEESKRLLMRAFESRWTSKEDAERAIKERLDAGNTLLPAINNMQIIYKSLDGVKPY